VEQFGISPIAFAEFWNLNAAEPRTKNAASPLRKLFNMFYVNPQRAKLPLFLIYHALNHPLMIFHGLGIHTAKKVVYTYKKDLASAHRRSSSKLVASFSSLCKRSTQDCLANLIVWMKYFIDRQSFESLQLCSSAAVTQRRRRQLRVILMDISTRFAFR
jgi:hypothetical protein